MPVKKMRSPDHELGERILELARRLLETHVHLDMIERQFFFQFWCLDYIDNVEKLRRLLPKDFHQEALHGGGFDWVLQKSPEAARIMRELREKYGIIWQDVLGHVMGSLPLSGYSKAEYYLPEADRQLVVSVPPGSLAIILHHPSQRDFDAVPSEVIRQLLHHRRRRPDVKKYVRRCACLCLSDRAGYGNRPAIKIWNQHFSQLAYGKEEIANETQPAEMQFAREKRETEQRFRQLEAGQVRFLTDFS